MEWSSPDELDFLLARAFAFELGARALALGFALGASSSSGRSGSCFQGGGGGADEPSSELSALRLTPPLQGRERGWLS